MLAVISPNLVYAKAQHQSQWQPVWVSYSRKNPAGPRGSGTELHQRGTAGQLEGK